MTDLSLFEVRLVKAPKHKVWQAVSRLDREFQDGVESVTVAGAGKDARRSVVLRGGRTRDETIVAWREGEAMAWKRQDPAGEHELSLELREHDLGTILVHKGRFEAVSPVARLVRKGGYRKDLRSRLEGIKQALES